jgi:S-(hydroxymethyl)glutathione dehydrogenase/alcohol dehydrogenase
MKTEAAILVKLAQPLELVELEIPPLKPGQVLVEIAFSGVCHTQLLEARGHRGADPFLPHCLGHEGSGVVRAVGPGVSRVSPGQAVVLSWLKAGGINVPGSGTGGAANRSSRGSNHLQPPRRHQRKTASARFPPGFRCATRRCWAAPSTGFG